VMPRGTYLARSSVSSACVDACFSTLTGPLQQIPSATVDAHAAAVERLWPGRHPKVTLLSGGITNLNFKVEVDGAAYVLRMGGAKTGLLGIDRSVEHAASLRAEEIGIGPAVVDFVPSEGWLVASFIDGHAITPQEMRKPATMARVAEALRKLHSAAAIPGRFDAHEVVAEYRAEADSHAVEIPAEFGAAHAISERIRAARGPQPLVPCHNDLLNANFLDDGEIRIVDWEYAGMGDRFFDLANFSVNHEFEVEDDGRLLAAYFGQERESDLAALRLMRFMSDFREAMWGVLQSGISELDFDFKGYASKHFERLERTAAEPEFAGYLSVVG
jgi:thiamine kinase-like enzyme